jgi:hypothetical protein
VTGRGVSPDPYRVVEFHRGTPFAIVSRLRAQQAAMFNIIGAMAEFERALIVSYASNKGIAWRCEELLRLGVHSRSCLCLL